MATDPVRKRRVDGAQVEQQLEQHGEVWLAQLAAEPQAWPEAELRHGLHWLAKLGVVQISEP